MFKAKTMTNVKLMTIMTPKILAMLIKMAVTELMVMMMMMMKAIMIHRLSSL